MNFEKKVLEAISHSRKGNKYYDRGIGCLSVFILVMVFAFIMAQVMSAQKFYSYDPVMWVIIIAASLVLSIPLKHLFFMIERTNRRKRFRKRVVSKFPEGTSADDVLAKIDQMEKIEIRNGEIYCGSEIIAYYVDEYPTRCRVLPVNKITEIGIKNRSVALNGEIISAKDSCPEAWELCLDLINKTGRADLLQPKMVCCAALQIARVNLARMLMDFTGLKPGKFTDVVAEAKREAKRRNDEAFTYAVKNISFLLETVTGLVYDSDSDFGGDMAFYSRFILNEKQEEQLYHKVAAFIAENPAAYDVDIMIAVCGGANEFRGNELRKFDGHPKAMWETADLGVGKILKPMLETEWKFRT